MTFRFEEIENTFGILTDIETITQSYGDLLTPEQCLAIQSYYKQAYYGKIGKEYSESERNIARTLINQQLEFLKNETFDSRRYKVKLINRLTFETWISWIFGKIILFPNVKNIAVKPLNLMIKEYFVDKKTALFADIFKQKIEVLNV